MNASSIKNWIYVTGAPRSGTTFIGKILSMPLSVDYIHEPFNPDCGMPGITQRFQFAEANGPDNLELQSMCEDLFQYRLSLKTGYYRNDTSLRKALKRVVGSRGQMYLRLAKMNPLHKHAVVKDPIGCLVTDYLYGRFGVKPVIVLRHPLAVVASTIRLGWDDSHELDVDDLWRQQLLVQTYFSEDASFVGRQWGTVLEKSAAIWRAINKVLLAQASRHDDWLVVRHEDISTSPLESFKQLYDQLQLPWSGRVQSQIQKYTGAGNRVESGGAVQDFKRDSAQILELRKGMLTPSERATVLEITGDVATQWYAEETFDT